jgi:hypothetical protein
MKWLTKQEINLLMTVVFLFLVGLAVKTWRGARVGELPAIEQRK